jgi:Anti-sigma-K factor rskA
MTSHPDGDQLTLAALPAEQADPEVAAHLLVCGQCRAEVDELRRTVELARVDGVGEPLPIPPTRVWQAILDELAGDEAGAEIAAAPDARAHRLPPADEPGPPDRPVSLDDRRPQRAPWWRRSAVGVAAAAVVGLGLGAGVGFGLGGSGDEPVPAPLVRLAPVGFADPQASGTAAMVDRNGDTRMVVELRGVTNLAGGDYLEAWLMDAGGSRLLPLGALARHGEEFHGEFTIPAGLPPGEYIRVDVSAERFDGNPAHSAVSLLRGDLA